MVYKLKVVLSLIQEELSNLTTRLDLNLLIYLLATGIFIVFVLAMYFYFHVKGN
jgi:hypothetical protein